MKSVAMHVSATPHQQELSTLKAIDPNLLIFFAAPQWFENHASLAFLREHFSEAHILGCSSAGEIGIHGVSDARITLIAMHFDRTPLAVHSTVIANGEDSFRAGKDLALPLKKSGLKGVFMLAPGVDVNGSQLVRGIEKQIGGAMPITGGLAGDGMNFTKTYTYLNGVISDRAAVAVGFYGEAVRIGFGSQGGWQPFGPARRITKSAGNILYELDGKPALQLYKEYLSDKAADLPSSGLFYPFAILREDHSRTGLIRTLLNVDHEAQSLIMAGDMPEDSLVCLMHAETDGLTDGARQAAVQAHQGCNSSVTDHAAILISCVGRKIVMGDDVAEEVETAQAILGQATPLAGFYSYGEIAPYAETGLAELHNQTMTITCLSEV